MAVDFTRGLVPLDTTPLMQVFAMKEDKRRYEEDVARMQRIDAMNATTATLEQDILRKELEALQANNPQQLQDLIGHTVRIATNAEGVLGEMEAGVTENGPATTDLAMAVQDAQGKFAGTRWADTFDRLPTLVKRGDWESVVRTMDGLMQEVGVAKAYAGEIQALRDLRGAEQKAGYVQEVINGIPVQRNLENNKLEKSPLMPDAPQTVFINDRLSAFEDKFGEGMATEALERNEEAKNAVTQNAQLEAMKVSLARGIETGALADWRLAVMQFAEQWGGYDFGEEVSESERFAAGSKSLALLIRNPESGMGLPGATSNFDIKFLMGAVPSLQKSERGNMLLIDYAMRVNRMKMDTALEQMRIIEENGGTAPSDLSARMLRYMNDYTILTDSEKADIQAFMDESAPPSQAIPSPGGGNIPDAAVQELMSDPSEQNMRDFDAVFGQGSAAQILGR